MPYKEEDICVALASVLGGITTSAGYENDVGTDSVQRFAAPPLNEDVDFAKFPAFILINGREETEHHKTLLVRTIWPRIRGLIKEDRSTPSTKVNSLKGDLIKALYANETLGGNVHGLWVTGSSPLDSEEKPYAGFELTVKLKFESTTTNP